MTKRSNPHRGSRFEDLLEADGIAEAVTVVAQKRVVAWQLAQLMAKQKITRSAMAKRMNTSRAVLDRLLDPDNGSVTLQTIARAAAAVGRTVDIRLVKPRA
jgi:hypothetical protein